MWIIKDYTIQTYNQSANIAHLNVDGDVSWANTSENHIDRLVIRKGIRSRIGKHGQTYLGYINFYDYSNR